MKIIDLRSDTVTLPGPAMRQAIAAAELGDKALEEKGIRFLSTEESTFRMVTHYGIEPEDVETAISALSQCMKRFRERKAQL